MLLEVLDFFSSFPPMSSPAIKEQFNLRLAEIPKVRSLDQVKLYSICFNSAKLKVCFEVFPLLLS